MDMRFDLKQMILGMVLILGLSSCATVEIDAQTGNNNTIPEVETPPSTPSTLVFTGATPNSISVAWDLPTLSKTEISTYEIQVDETTPLVSVDFPNNGVVIDNLMASTTYQLKIRACGKTSVCSEYTSVITASTIGAPDTAAPSIPTGLSSNGKSTTSISVMWNASTDNVGVQEYRVRRNNNNSLITVVNANMLNTNFTGLSPNTSYAFDIQACDASDNCSAFSSDINVTTLALPDTQAPTVPSGLNASNIQQNTATLTWTAATDNSGVAPTYKISVNNGAAVSVMGTSYSATGLTAGTSNNFKVLARDGTGNESAYSNAFSFNTSTAPDTQAPTVPTGLNASNVQQTTATLAWNPSTDNLAVTSYKVSIDNGSPITVNTNSHPISGYTAGSTHNFKVLARDAAGNESAYATAVNFTMAVATSVPSFSSNNSTKVSVTAFATVQSSSITLKWGNISGVSFNTATIFRKPKTSSTWTQIGTTPGNNNQYVDSTVAVGTYYEYKIQISNSSGATAYGYVASGIEVPVVENRGKLILLIDSAVSSLSGMSSRLTTLRNDLKGDGWTLIESTISGGTPASVKTIIQNAYNVDSSNVKAIFMIGHIPVARSGLYFGPDGHGDHKGPWAADGYFADMNGTWTDNGTHNNTSNDYYDNNQNDGLFDQNNFPSTLELQIGRVDFYYMDEFSANYGIAHDPVLYNAYFDRLHEYRAKITSPQKRAFIQDNFTEYNFAATGFRNFPALVGADNITSRQGSSPTMFNDLNNQSYLFAYGCGSGGHLSAAGVSNTGELANGNWGGVFNFTFGSYFGEWQSNNNNFLRAIITGGAGLTNMWVGATQGHFHNMAMGDTIGYGAQITMNNKISGIYYPETGGNGTGVGSYDNVELSLMGDPTLRINMIKPPTNLAVNVSGNLLFSWSAPSGESGVSYIVYQVGANGGLTRVTPNPISATSYQSNISNAVQNKDYIVVSYKLTTSQTGSYYNRSIGSNVVTR